MGLADRVSSKYANVFARIGEDVKVRRYSGVAPTRTHADYTIKARVAGYEPHELVGTIIQGDRRVIASAADLVAAGMTLPVTTADKLVVRSKELSIIAVDDSTRRVGSTLIAIEMQVRG